MRKIVTIASGVTVMLMALWTGAYVLGQIPHEHWAGFPTFMTSVLVGMGGYGVVMYGAIYVKGQP